MKKNHAKVGSCMKTILLSLMMLVCSDIDAALWRERIQPHIPTKQRLLQPDALVAQTMAATIVFLACINQWLKKNYRAAVKYYNNKKVRYGELCNPGRNFEDFDLGYAMRTLILPKNLDVPYKLLDHLKEDCEKIYCTIPEIKQRQESIQNEERRAIYLYAHSHSSSKDLKTLPQLSESQQSAVIINFIMQKIEGSGHQKAIDALKQCREAHMNTLYLMTDRKDVCP
jgi:hypothetical protein